jgi:hypothetical protein
MTLIQRRSLFSIAFAVLWTHAGVNLLCAPAMAAEFLAYSFETGLEGFGANGGGTTVTLDTIGATDGTSSLKFSQVAGATFTGAITTSLDPTFPGSDTVIGDPPGIDYILFDLTLPETYPPPKIGGFARASVTVFGSSQPDYPGGQLHGLAAQFFDNEISIAGAAGTYRDLRIDLASAPHPLTFEGGSFNDIFGTIGSGLNDVIPSSFQIYVNKRNDSPLTVYIDNIRVGILPPPVPGDFNQDGKVDAADYVVWRKHLNTSNELPNDNDLGVPITSAHYDLWRQNFGSSPPPPGVGSLSAVPEPGAIALLFVAGALYWIRSYRFAGSEMPARNWAS